MNQPVTETLASPWSEFPDLQDLSYPAHLTELQEQLVTLTAKPDAIDVDVEETLREVPFDYKAIDTEGLPEAVAQRCDFLVHIAILCVTTDLTYEQLKHAELDPNQLFDLSSVSVMFNAAGGSRLDSSIFQNVLQYNSPELNELASVVIGHDIDSQEAAVDNPIAGMLVQARNTIFETLENKTDMPSTLQELHFECDFLEDRKMKFNDLTQNQSDRLAHMISVRARLDVIETDADALYTEIVQIDATPGQQIWVLDFAKRHFETHASGGRIDESVLALIVQAKNPEVTSWMLKLLGIDDEQQVAIGAHIVGTMPIDEK